MYMRWDGAAAATPHWQLVFFADFEDGVRQAPVDQMNARNTMPLRPTETEAELPSGRFAGSEGHADTTVVIVTYRSARDVDGLINSLRAETIVYRIRVIVADNASPDDTLAVVRAHDDVIVLDTGGNLGYAAGINVAVRAAGDTDTLLILNPDLRVEPGCVAALLARMHLQHAGVVVPRILDISGATYPSLRREPTVPRAFADALLGNKRSWGLSEIVTADFEYRHAHTVDWATGAALLIDLRVAREVGEWDERFFLYSEETDFFLRVRAAGYQVWYEPAATVQHLQGGSGTSVELDRLLAVNRIRYARKHRGKVSATIYRSAVILHELVRFSRPAHRAVLQTVLSESSWNSLPRATPTLLRKVAIESEGAIIIPAHNEAGVIGRTLGRLAPVIASPNVDVIVAANGSSDGTAELARSVPGVKVLEIGQASKPAALNFADASTARWPRLYLDADIEITPRAIIDTLAALAKGGALAARPRYEWNLDDATWPVRAYYRARRRIPSAHAALWGAGVYGMSAAGRRRFGRFPVLTADDLFVDQQFTTPEKMIVNTDPVVVRVPRTTRDLLNVLRRQARGASELKSETSASTLRELLRSIRGPRSLVDAGAYAVFALLSRRHKSNPAGWERDESSRGTSVQDRTES